MFAHTIIIAKDGQERNNLLEWLIYLLSGCVIRPSLEAVSVALLRLLCTLTVSCQAAAREILRSSNNSSFLLDIIKADKQQPQKPVVSTHIKSLAALLLGLCLEYWGGDEPDEKTGLGRKEVQAMIEDRVGSLNLFASIQKVAVRLVE